jgi:hypothetical protein
MHSALSLGSGGCVYNFAQVEPSIRYMPDTVTDSEALIDWIKASLAKTLAQYVRGTENKDQNDL